VSAEPTGLQYRLGSWIGDLHPCAHAARQKLARFLGGGLLGPFPPRVIAVEATIERDAPDARALEYFEGDRWTLD
jgi:hypothetical protein